jgi:hypothetical protein
MGSGACTVTASGKVTPTEAGNCLITAVQAGSSDYAEAPPVKRTLVIERVAGSPTTVTLTPARKTTKDGRTLKFAAKVKPDPKKTPLTGTVDFYLDGKLIDSASLTKSGVEKYSYTVTLAPSATPYEAEAVFVSSTPGVEGSHSAISHITVKS